MTKNGLLISILLLAAVDLTPGQGSLASVVSNLRSEGVSDELYVYYAEGELVVRGTCADGQFGSIGHCNQELASLPAAEVFQAIDNEWTPNLTLIDQDLASARARIEDIEARQAMLLHQPNRCADLLSTIADYDERLVHLRRALRDLSDQVALIRAALARDADDPSLRHQLEVVIAQLESYASEETTILRSRTRTLAEALRQDPDCIADEDSYRLLERQRQHWDTDIRRHEQIRTERLRQYAASLRIREQLRDLFVHDYRLRVPNRPEDKRVVRSVARLFE